MYITNLRAVSAQLDAGVYSLLSRLNGRNSSTAYEERDMVDTGVTLVAALPRPANKASCCTFTNLRLQNIFFPHAYFHKACRRRASSLDRSYRFVQATSASRCCWPLQHLLLCPSLEGRRTQASHRLTHHGPLHVPLSPLSPPPPYSSRPVPCLHRRPTFG